MHLLDRQYTKTPFYGWPRMTASLRREGYAVNPRRVRRLMALMGLQAIHPKRRTSTPAPGHKRYPYLLRGLKITGPCQVRSTAGQQFSIWLRCAPCRSRRRPKGGPNPAVGAWIWQSRPSKRTAEVRWSSKLRIAVRLALPAPTCRCGVASCTWWPSSIGRRCRTVLAWQLSNTVDGLFCRVALRQELEQGMPAIFNTDQGARFTAIEFTGILEAAGIQVSMGGRGRALDNVFVERLWRTVKQEHIYLVENDPVPKLEAGLHGYFHFYNHERPHQSLGYQTPAEVHHAQALLGRLVGI